MTKAKDISGKQKVFFLVPEKIYKNYKVVLLLRDTTTNTTQEINSLVRKIVQTKNIEEVTPKMIEYKDTFANDKMTKVCVNIDERMYKDFKMVLIEKDTNMVTVFNEHILRTLCNEREKGK